MKTHLSRRQWMATSLAAGAAVGAAQSALAPAAVTDSSREELFGYCLNTSTIQGQRMSLLDEVEIAAKVGYQGIEPWIGELDTFVKGGGRLKELGKRIRDLGLRVESSIGFYEWIVDDGARRKKGFEEARRGMAMVQQLGGKRIAAPPAGATNAANINLYAAAERYRALIELGATQGVVPEVEVWGFSQTLGRLGEAAQVAIESGHPDACVLADVYHLYKGGSGFANVKLLSAAALPVIHFNDYPASPARDRITDAQRVYPGDGVAPLKALVRDLRTLGFRGMLSLELFNRDYWNQDAVVVARTGLEKMRAVVQSSRD